jgi:hypothetical protein
MHNKMSHSPFFMYNFNEVPDKFITIQIIDTQSAFYSAGDIYTGYKSFHASGN